MMIAAFIFIFLLAMTMIWLAFKVRKCSKKIDVLDKKFLDQVQSSLYSNPLEALKKKVVSLEQNVSLALVQKEKKKRTPEQRKITSERKKEWWAAQKAKKMAETKS